MNANSKLNQILKETSVKKPAHFNRGTLFTTQFSSAEPKSEVKTNKILTDEELGLKPVRRSTTKENKEE